MSTEFGRRVRRAMGARPVAEVALAAGVRTRVLYRMLGDGADDEDFRLSTIRKVAKACKVRPGFLAFGEEL